MRGIVTQTLRIMTITSNLGDPGSFQTLSPLNLISLKSKIQLC
jgi:hypothetical protein